MNTSNIKSSLLTAGVLILMMTSCSKDKQLDADLLSNGEEGMVSYVAGGSLVLLNGNNYAFTNKYPGVPVKLISSAKSADTAVATVVPELVSEYNRLHQENNPLIPEGAFGLAHNGRFSIAAGASIATDSLSVILVNGAGLKDKTVYLVPLRIETRNGAKLKYTTYYFKIMITTGELRTKLQGVNVYNNVNPDRLPGGAMSLLYLFAYPDSLKFRTSINTLFPVHDVQVEGTLLTNAQIDSMSTAKRLGAIPLPSANYELTKSLTTIPTTSVLSKDSLTIRFKNKASLTKFKYYAIGLKLKHYKGSQYGVVPVANDSSIVIMRFFLN